MTAQKAPNMLTHMMLALGWFAWYDSAPQNPLDHFTTMTQAAPYTNATGVVRVWSEAEWDHARRLGLKVIVGYPHEMFLMTDVNRPIPLDADMGWWGQPGLDIRTPADWLNIMLRHRDEIAFIGVIDEYDCGVPYSEWLTNTMNCANAAAKIEANLAEIRRYLPGVKTHVNYTSQFAAYFTDPGVARPWWLTTFGIRLASADYVGFDCYSLFEKCARTGTRIVSVKDLIGDVARPDLGGMIYFMTPSQQIILIPRAFDYPFLCPAVQDFCGITVPQTVTMLWQYHQLAMTHPRVGGVLPFIYFDLFGTGTGAISVPAIASTVAQMGAQYLGRLDPTVQPPGRVTGVRILPQ